MENNSDQLSTETREFVRRFYTATRFGNPKDIKSFIDYFSRGEFEINSQIPIHFNTVLVLATEHKDYDLIVDARKFGTKHWIRPLGLAVYFKCTEMIRLLVRHRVDINSEVDSYRGWSAIELACWRRHVPTISLILELGADVSGHVGVRCLEGCFANEEAMRVLIAKGADVNGTTTRGDSLLSVALMQNQPTVRDILYENGSSMECIGDKELYAACFAASREMVEFILDKTQATVAKRIEALELLGAGYICNYTCSPSLSMTRSVWTEAVQLRQTAEPGYLTTNDDRCAVLDGFQLVAVPNNVSEVLALASRPADAYFLGLMITYKHVAPTWPDLEKQVLSSADHIVETLEDPTVDVYDNPQYIIDLYMIHLRALVFYRKLRLVLKYEPRYTLIAMTTEDPFPIVSYSPDLHRAFKYKQQLLLDERMQITPEARSRWINAGLDILEAMVEESELFFRLKKFIDCTGHPEEEVAGIRAATWCPKFPLIHTMGFLAFMFMLHTDRFESTYGRLQSFAFRFIQCCDSDPRIRCEMFSIAISQDVSIVRGIVNEDDISETQKELALTRFLISCGADPTCRDSEGDTLLHYLIAGIRWPSDEDISDINASWDYRIPGWLESLIEQLTTLVELGVHLDARNLKGQVASQTLCSIFPNVFSRVFQFETLQCLSARELRRVNYPSHEIPQHLSRFVSLH